LPSQEKAGGHPLCLSFLPTERTNTLRKLPQGKSTARHKATDGHIQWFFF